MTQTPPRPSAARAVPSVRPPTESMTRSYFGAAGSRRPPRPRGRRAGAPPPPARRADARRDVGAGEPRELHGEVADAAGGAGDEHAPAEEGPPLPRRVERGQPRHRERRGLREGHLVGQHGEARSSGTATRSADAPSPRNPTTRASGARPRAVGGGALDHAGQVPARPPAGGAIPDRRTSPRFSETPLRRTTASHRSGTGSLTGRMTSRPGASGSTTTARLVAQRVTPLAEHGLELAGRRGVAHPGEPPRSFISRAPFEEGGQGQPRERAADADALDPGRGELGDREAGIGGAHHHVDRLAHRRDHGADGGEVSHAGRVEHVGAGLLEGLQAADGVVEIAAVQGFSARAVSMKGTGSGRATSTAACTRSTARSKS